MELFQLLLTGLTAIVLFVFGLENFSKKIERISGERFRRSLSSATKYPVWGVVIGAVVTMFIQSSSATSVISISLVNAGVLSFKNSLGIIFGSNVGTTITAQLVALKLTSFAPVFIIVGFLMNFMRNRASIFGKAVFNMDIAAKKTALSHFLFNVGGVLLSLPFLFMFGDQLANYEDNPAMALANIHLIFKVTASLIFTILINPFTRFVDFLMGEGTMDFDRMELPQLADDDDFDSIKRKLDSSSAELLRFLEENYNMLTLSVETNYRGVFEAAEKRIEYMDFVKTQYLHFFASAVSAMNKKSESRALVKLINQFDYLFQIHDSITDLFEAKRVINDTYIELKSDLLILIRGLASQTLDYFDEIVREMHDKPRSTDQ